VRVDVAEGGSEAAVGLFSLIGPIAVRSPNEQLGARNLHDWTSMDCTSRVPAAIGVPCERGSDGSGLKNTSGHRR
jgi:hypothetical protein